MAKEYRNQIIGVYKYQVPIKPKRQNYSMSQAQHAHKHGAAYRVFVTNFKRRHFGAITYFNPTLVFLKKILYCEII